MVVVVIIAAKPIMLHLCLTKHISISSAILSLLHWSLLHLLWRLRLKVITDKAIVIELIHLWGEVSCLVA